jgi:hypothetical protein
MINSDNVSYVHKPQYIVSWKHEASRYWIDARRNYLTATDVIYLLPEMRRRIKKPTDSISEQVAVLYSKKITHSLDDDALSFNAAARGHILEASAIANYNHYYETHRTLYHWDDCLIHNDTVAFSPDALTIAQPSDAVEINQADLDSNDESNSIVIGEVKSYSAGEHIKAYLSEPNELSERYQIAVAMYVCSLITFGSIIFYHPSHAISIFIKDYKRDDLADEIAEVEQVVDMWNEDTLKLQEKLCSDIRIPLWTEEQIYLNWQAKQLKQQQHILET